MRSKKWFLNASDFLKGLLMAIGGSLATALAAILQTGALPTMDDIRRMLVIGAGVGVYYLLKNWISNSQGQITKPEPPVTPTV